MNTSTPTPIPENLPEELLPVYDWWKEKGPRFLTQATIVVLLAAGVYAGMHYLRGQRDQANAQLSAASTADELETLINTYGSTGAGKLAQLKLARAYYDTGRPEQALETYDAFLAKQATSPFAPIAELGRAHALEAMNRADEAQTAFQAFAAAHPDHYLVPQATLGLARTWVLKGDKAKAKDILEGLKATKKDTPWEMAASQLEGVVDRYEPRAARSLFDLADEAAAKAGAAAPATVEAVPVPAMPETGK